ncbi:MAG: hypothetical protein EXX96DRAFT_485788 [Benjaminiella poitrasii]|nr:MAG: hypothetical protein EXX96DRAFT_485788 [Benjaminiella poitrasii]
MDRRKRPRNRINHSHNQLLKKVDFVSLLFSKELVLKVFSFLSHQDLITCAVVSNNWSRIANDETLWKPLFYKQFRDPLLPRDNKLSKQFYDSVIQYGGSWKMKYRIHHNWLFELLHQQNIYITALKLTPSTKDMQHLVAGYSNGGFTLWELSMHDIISTTNNSILDEIHELATYAPTNNQNEVKSIGIDYPMILIYTENKKLSIFHLGHNLLNLVHQLQSPVDWHPVVIDIHPIISHSNRKLWKVMLCFGLLSGERNYRATAVGIQEIILSPRSILSSRQALSIHSEPNITSSSDDGLNDTASEQMITSMAYTPPYLITAHPNNTMKQYLVALDDNNHMNVTFQQIVYGHAFRVDALAISKQKLISGDRSGIKIRNLYSLKHEEFITLNHYSEQSKMNELPECRVESISFDEDKIMAVVNSPSEETSFIRLWSFK